MKEKLYCIHQARFSFTSFTIVMAIAGIIIAVIPSVLDILFSSWRWLTGDPEISVGTYLNILGTFVLAPIEGAISGMILYPFYKKIFKKAVKLKVVIYGTDADVSGFLPSRE